MFEDLPTELTELILMKLSMRDAFKASTVSKNWIQAWNSTPKLVLDDENFMRFDNNYESMFIEFAERVLSSHKSPILQFHLSTRIENKMKINRWLFFSMRYNKIKELHLEVRYARKYKVPQRLFSCHELVHLKLVKCKLTPPQDFKGYKDLVLPSLRDMKLETVKLSLPTLPPDSITNLVSECHQLKKLDVMIHYPDYQEIQIVSTSLQSLKIGRCYSHLHLACPQLIDASIYIDTDLYYWDSVSSCSRLRKEQQLSLKELEYRQTKVTLPVAFNHLEKLSLETKADLEEIALAEADIINLKHKISDLRGQLSHQARRTDGDRQYCYCRSN
ncbi:hypothetical protein J5N97_003163 [Dioscorea zingiberensis]|uniref:F-box domain-containing protein n=1 Tax=Dioscorea zingiberensis TaxID=325984 RepID=A0A9D5D5P8_9LILI|nr:hypothetical protein J5N97_003163 [Dioscorea zingiberensis]